MTAATQFGYNLTVFVLLAILYVRSLDREGWPNLVIGLVAVLLMLQAGRLLAQTAARVLQDALRRPGDQP